MDKLPSTDFMKALLGDVFGTTPNPCTCDYDCVGDPARYERCLPKCCPVHDMCQWCDERLGTILVSPEGGYSRAWICDECQSPSTVDDSAYDPCDLRDIGGMGVEPR